MTERARTDAEISGAVPPAGQVKFRLLLHDSDGETARHFTPGGPVEVWLEASEQPVDAVGAAGRRSILVPLAFPNYPIAHVHAEGLKAAIGQLERALERAHKAADASIASRDDGHRHIVRLTRYRRALPFVAICEVCMEQLVDDVNAWALDRRIEWDIGTIKGAIEQAVNRDG